MQSPDRKEKKETEEDSGIGSFISLFSILLSIYLARPPRWGAPKSDKRFVYLRHGDSVYPQWAEQHQQQIKKEKRKKEEKTLAPKNNSEQKQQTPKSPADTNSCPKSRRPWEEDLYRVSRGVRPTVFAMLDLRRKNQRRQTAEKAHRYSFRRRVG